MTDQKTKGAAFATIQKVGRSFFLPVSILPVAGLLLGVGASFTNESTISLYHLETLLGKGTLLNGLLTIFSQAGSVIFGNLPIIFAMAVALGMAKNERAVAVLASAISFFVMHASINAMLRLTGYILPDGSYSDKVLDGMLTGVCGIDSLQMGVFGGIIVGLGVAALHNRFYKQQLPAALSFFAGIRFVPIISILTYALVGIVCFFVWPAVQNGIYAVGGLVTSSGYAGTFLFGFMERALIPFGLHHVFYIPFWQTGLGGTAIIDGVTVAGAQNIYFAELVSPSVSRFSVEACRFMTGKYAVMMAGLPGAAYAMYRTAKPQNRKIVGGLLLSAALTSFLTGITEPIEFTFLFIAPALFGLHCVFAGLSFLLTHLFNICIGTTFSCGLIDFTLYGLLQGNAKTNWLAILPIYLAYAVGYYFIFRFCILKWNLLTPGREEGGADIQLYTKADYNKKKAGQAGDSCEKKDTLSPMILEGLGGLDNVLDVDCCATRLRCTVKNMDLLNEPILKKTGAKGVIKSGGGVQVIYGPHVSIIKADLAEYIEAVKAGLIKPEEKVKLLAPASGTVIAMTEVSDPAFSSLALGDGIAVRPENGMVTAPVAGEINVIMPAGHAVGIHVAEGFDILLHVGIDTVSLNGEGFETLVEVGQRVCAGDPVLKFDKDLIENKGYCSDVIMILLESDQLPEIEYKNGMRAEAGKTEIACVK